MTTEDLEKFIRKTLKEKRPDMAPEEVDLIVKTTTTLKFMRSTEAIERFIKTVSK